MLVDTAVAPSPDEVPWVNPAIEPGERRQVVTGIPGKTGIVYTLDRATGEFLWARETLFQNVVSDIDGATGKVTVNPDTLFTAAGQQITICPAAAGGRNWPAGAYSPLTNAMYVPMQNTCMDASVQTGERDPSQVYGLDMPPQLAPNTDQLGSIWAVSAETGEALWRFDQRAAALSLVATGGGLIFGGDSNGGFRAFDDETGEILWETNLDSPVSGFPISFAVDGRQYVAVSTGPSLVAATAGRLLPEFEPTTGGSNVFVFALPIEN